jgi:hypothetical protein
MCQRRALNSCTKQGCDLHQGAGYGVAFITTIVQSSSYERAAELLRDAVGAQHDDVGRVDAQGDFLENGPAFGKGKLLSPALGTHGCIA